MSSCSHKGFGWGIRARTGGYGRCCSCDGVAAARRVDATGGCAGDTAVRFLSIGVVRVCVVPSLVLQKAAVAMARPSSLKP